MKKLFKSIIYQLCYLWERGRCAACFAAWSGWQNQSEYSGRVFTYAATYTRSTAGQLQNGNVSEIIHRENDLK